MRVQRSGPISRTVRHPLHPSHGVRSIRERCRQMPTPPWPLWSHPQHGSPQHAPRAQQAAEKAAGVAAKAVPAESDRPTAMIFAIYFMGNSPKNRMFVRFNLFAVEAFQERSPMRPRPGLSLADKPPWSCTWRARLWKPAIPMRNFHDIPVQEARNQSSDRDNNCPT